MTIARRLLVDKKRRGIYHWVSRCVRRAFLCGDGFDHRKDWIRDRLLHLSRIYAVDVGAYAIMRNHLHLVVRADPRRAQRWSPLEVVERWSRLIPADVKRWVLAHGLDDAASDDPELLAGARWLKRAVAALATDRVRIQVLRNRLGDLSWFMKCLKEPIARRANREDGCRGHFWEARFSSYALLDDSAVLACMVYVDLNVVRAAQATKPEASDHTSIQDRIRARRPRRRPTGSPGRAAAQQSSGSVVRELHVEDGGRLVPIERTGDSDRDGLLPMTLDEYLRIVDSTGRLLRAGTRVSIPDNLAPLLERLAVDETRRTTALSRPGRLLGTAVGSAASRAADASRRGTRWVVGTLDVYRLLKN